MDIFREEIQDICKAFNTFNVRYLLVGGFAVNYHGYPRSTGDLDLWIDPSEENKSKLILALEDQNFNIQELKELSLEKAAPIDIPIYNFKIELIPFLSTSLAFNEAYEKAVKGHIDDIEIKVIHLNHLIQLKSNTNRLKDMLDVEELKKRNNIE